MGAAPPRQTGLKELSFVVFLHIFFGVFSCQRDVNLILIRIFIHRNEIQTSWNELRRTIRSCIERLDNVWNSSHSGRCDGNFATNKKNLFLFVFQRDNKKKI